MYGADLRPPSPRPMPKRPESHRLEARSLKAFQDSVPDAWSVDTPSQGADYGIDAMVELFDEADEAEGLGFYVQVKATQERDLSRALKQAFEVATLDYYGKLERPVLMVRYHHPTGSLYAGWHHRMDDGSRKSGQKTKTLRWGEPDRWTEATAPTLARDVRRYAAARRPAGVKPVAASVIVRPGDALTADRARALRRVLRSYPREHVSFTVDAEADNAVAQVEIDGEWAAVDYGGVAATRANLPAALDSRVAARALVDTVVCLVGVAAGGAGHVALGAALVAEHVEDASIRFSPDFVPTAIVVLVEGGRREFALDYVHHLYDVAADEGLSGDERRVVLEGAGWAATHLRFTAGTARHYLEEIHHLLLREVEVRAGLDRGPSLGAALYTLANFLTNEDGSERATREAVRLFNAARKSDPAYCDRAYFASELAGALFGVSRSRAAAAWYERAIELGQDDDETRAYWGDALLLCGRFAEAADAMKAWGDHWERPFWWLKWWTAEWLRDTRGAVIKRRQLDAANVVRDGASAGKHPSDWADAVLALDPLNAGAAFNMGLGLSERGQWGAAVRYFVLCAMLYPQDSESWRNALLSAFNAAIDLEIVALRLAIGRAAAETRGAEFFEAVEDAIDKHPDPSARDAFDAALSALRDAAQEPERMFTVRVYPQDHEP